MHLKFYSYSILLMIIIFLKQLFYTENISNIEAFKDRIDL